MLTGRPSLYHDRNASAGDQALPTIPTRLAAAIVLLVLAVDPGSTAWATASTGSCDVAVVDSFSHGEQILLREINAYRAAQGLHELAMSPSLNRAALWKSVSRADGGPDGHDDGERTWDQRFDDCGYDSNSYIGEALAVSTDYPSEEAEALRIFELWKTSPVHEHTISDPVYRSIGLAGVRLPDSSTTYWTADFGSVLEPSTNTD